MKKQLFLTIALTVLTALSASAQHYRSSRYYNAGTDRLDYSRGPISYKANPLCIKGGGSYVGLRIGPSFSTVNSESPILDGGKMKTGLNVGIVTGAGLSCYSPIYLETGLMYTEKGGKKEVAGNKFTYGLNYIEVPLTLKYIYTPDGHFSVQPYLGGYVACGVGGKIKDYGEREAYSSFSDDYSDNFKRFDGGLKAGIGIGYDNLYADVSYEYGLANIGHDSFDTTHNSSIQLNVGVNF